MTTWTLGPGRAIERDGEAVAYIERVRDQRTGNAPLTPFEADRLAQHIVDVLNTRRAQFVMEAGYEPEVR